MSFNNILWQKSEPVYQAILAHPFIKELKSGTLSKEVFRFYIQQDALYLADFGRALAIVGSKAPDPTRMLDFVKFAEGAVIVERALHEEYFKKFGVDGTAEKSPSCFSYTNFLLSKTALSPYEVGVAALLPCFWIYREVGNHIVANAAENNFYQEWINTYSGEEYSALVDGALEISQEAAERASEEEKIEMQKAYLYAVKLEWMFWDSAYQLEKWKP